MFAACGHIACFWCVFRAMDTRHGSHCPVCRNPYNHFPSICWLLNFVLLKLYPSAYKGRETQVIGVFHSTVKGLYISHVFFIVGFFQYLILHIYIHYLILMI